MKYVSGREYGDEVVQRHEGELAPTAPVNKHIQHYRAINETNLRHALWAGMPVGLALGLAQTGTLSFALLAIPLVLVAVIAGVQIFRHRPKLIQAEITEFKSGDFTAWQMWAPFLPALGWIVVIPLDALGISGLQTPPLLTGLFSGLLLGTGLSFGWFGALSRTFRIGKRRIRKITENQSLDGVTQSRMDAVESHGDILGALIAVGAVDGNKIPIKTLCMLLKVDQENMEAVRSRVEDLQADGIVKISGQGLYRDSKMWEVTVTPDGIHNLAQIGQR